MNFRQQILISLCILITITFNHLEAMESSSYTPRPPAEEFAYHRCIPTLQTKAIIATSDEQLEALSQPTIRDYALSFKDFPDKTNPIELLKIKLNLKDREHSKFIEETLEKRNCHCLEHVLSHANFTQEMLDNLLFKADNTYHNLDAINLLLRWGAAGPFFTRWENFPLHAAIVQHIFCGKPLFVKQQNGKHFFYSATASNKELCLDEINEATINETRSEITGTPTILQLAAVYNRANIVKQLAPYASQENKDKALFWATEYGAEAVLLPLLDNGANANTWETEYANPSAVRQILLYQGVHADIHAIKWTPLHIACKYNFEDIARILITAKANLNTESQCKHTPLHIAATRNSCDTIAILIKEKANIEAQDSVGMTPLHLAVLHNSEGAATLLIKGNANLNAKSNDGTTPLYIAAHENHRKLASLLVESGAQINTERSDGYTPLLVAKKKGHLAIAKMLEQAAANKPH